MRAVPSRRASRADTRLTKKIQACAPLPERETSSATGTPSASQEPAKARASSRHSASSKSTARKWQVSSVRSGYTPTVCRPARWSKTVWPVTGISARCSQSPHSTRGFSQMPARHSFAHAGEQPDLPVLLSQRIGYTSSRPRNRLAKSFTFSSVPSRACRSVVVAGSGGCHAMPWSASNSRSRRFSANSRFSSSRSSPVITHLASAAGSGCCGTDLQPASWRIARMSCRSPTRRTTSR